MSIPTFENQLEKIGNIEATAQALLNPDPRLKHALSASEAAGLPNICISDQQGQYLSILCQLIGAKNVLELGCLGGYSTIWLAKNGAHVTSIEINPKHREVALANTKGQGLDNVEVILGSALDVLPKFVEEGKKFDFVFIDAGWDDQWENFELAVKLTRVGGCIYVDNVVMKMLYTEEGGSVESLVEKVGKVKEVDATLVNTIAGFRGHREGMIDGFLLAVVKE
ncbi:O-methyltransferase, family 3 [Glonium stellatum]|uniref:O-methyltransferase, family 3 n=1 Tax=Glonium stellatum TaxID=574774 RepID=A0A8E2EQM9_9PEZI|nr:O-methyltransferase, family 3 [Glonium stellatum]